MSAEPAHTVVLCEDPQHEVFVRQFLMRRRWDRRQIRAVRPPCGHGSAEQWVREHFPMELRAFRQRNSRAKTYLIVALDADTGTVDLHTRELDGSYRTE